MLEFMQDLGHGIYALDTGFQRPHFDAAYLIVDHGRAAFIDCGVNASVPRFMAALGHLGLGPEAVDYVIPTHVHLDHAGGAGRLMQALPQAQLLVHPRGLRHLIDPRALWAGALAVYGEAEMRRAYGALVPVAAARARASIDGEWIALGQRRLQLADTPGHARHHHCIWDETSRAWFSGDTFGLSYRELDSAQGAWMLPTSTPVQFDPEALAQSVTRLLSAQPQGIYLTHYGRVGKSAGEVQALGGQLLALAQDMATTAQTLREHPERHSALKHALLALYLCSLEKHGSRLSPQQVTALLEMDLELNAQGLSVWLDSTQVRRQSVDQVECTLKAAHHGVK